MGPDILKAKLDRPRFHAQISIPKNDSSLVRAVAYDPETLVLDATFRNGTKYRYRDVSPAVFARLVTALSPGKAFNEYLKPLPFRRLSALKKRS